jgi:hypothetical protein
LAQSLTEAQAKRLTDHVARQLQRGVLERPEPGEHEPAYCARQIRPLLKAAIDRLGIHGLLIAGPGAQPIRPVYVLGMRFYPDLAVMYHSSPTLAIEVKYLSTPTKQTAFASAVGQAMIYRIGGYQRSIVFVLEMAHRHPPEQSASAPEAFGHRDDLRLVTRFVTRRGVL